MPCNPGQRAVHRRDHDAAKTIKRRHFTLVISPPVINSRAAPENKCGRQIFGVNKNTKKNKIKRPLVMQRCRQITTFFSTPNACWLLQCGSPGSKPNGHPRHSSSESAFSVHLLPVELFEGLFAQLKALRNTFECRVAQIMTCVRVSSPLQGGDQIIIPLRWKVIAVQ